MLSIATPRSQSTATLYGAAYAAIALVACLPLLASAQQSQHGEQPPGATVEKARQTNADIAVEDYQKSDAKPTENWFGCPPVAKGDEAASKAGDDCEPVTPPAGAGS